MLLHSFKPPESGPSSTPSTRASNWHFSDQEDNTPNMVKEVPTTVVDPFSLNAKDGSEESFRGSEESSASLRAVLHAALARLERDNPQARAPAANPFFNFLVVIFTSG